MLFEPKNIRNIAILGHQGSGKTSLVEAIYYVTGNSKEMGTVEKKNTVSDYLVDEQKRLSSICSSLVPVTFNDHKINVIDLPGNDSFISEVLGVTRCIKGAVLVIDASVGVQVGTVKHYNTLHKRGVPTLIFINKMDKEEVIPFDELLEDIRTKLGKNAIPFCYPLGHEKSFDGFVDLSKMKAIIYDGKEPHEAEVYQDKKEKVLELRNMICEAVAGTSDELLEKFFLGETLSQEEINIGLRTAVLHGDLIPVLVGSATKAIGVKTMLEMFINYLPSPSDLKPIEASDGDGKPIEVPSTLDAPFSAYVFKNIVDPYAGNITLFKVNSGVLHMGDEIAVSDGRTFKVATLYSMCGKALNPITEIGAGDIGTMTRLERVTSGSTLSTSKNPIVFKPVKYPTAVFFKAIEVKNKNDESKIGVALSKIQLEDPCVETIRNNETKQLLLGGVSSSHIEFVIEKLKNTYKIDVNVSPMKVVYRESIKAVGQAIGRYVKQSGGSGFYGVVDMRFEPAKENSFSEEVFGGAVPKNYFPAVEKGFFEATKSGPLAGFPVIGVHAVLVDGKYHPVDSNETAFKMAAIFAFKEAYPKCHPIILEPVVRIRVNVESQYTGDVLSDLNTKRARIQNIEEKEHGNQEIEALVPEAEIIEYANQLKSITKASGFFNRKFYAYEEVPEYLKEKVIKENKIDNN